MVLVRSSALSSSELTRVNELDSQSLQAREKRRRLSREYKKDNSEFKERFDSLRNSMHTGTSSVSISWSSDLRTATHCFLTGIY